MPLEIERRKWDHSWLPLRLFPPHPRLEHDGPGGSEHPFAGISGPGYHRQISLFRLPSDLRADQIPSPSFYSFRPSAWPGCALPGHLQRSLRLTQQPFVPRARRRVVGGGNAREQVEVCRRNHASCPFGLKVAILTLSGTIDLLVRITPTGPLQITQKASRRDANFMRKSHN